MKSIKHELTEQQWEFVRHFVEMGGKGSGEPAAVQAGYSSDCAKQMAYKLVRKRHVRDAIYRYTRYLFAVDSVRARAALIDMVDDDDCPPAVRRAAALDVLQLADAESKLPQSEDEGLRDMDLSMLSEKEKDELEAIMAKIYRKQEADAVGLPDPIEHEDTTNG